MSMDLSHMEEIKPGVFQKRKKPANFDNLLNLDELESKGVDSESKLHDDIIKFCNEQFPKWKFIHSRMDKPSSIGVGIQDFTIFAKFPHCLLAECKAGNKKQDQDQLIWAKEMEILGWIVHVFRNMEQFMAEANKIKSLIKKPTYRANFLWPSKAGSVRSLGYEFANAQTEEYREEVWKELLKLAKLI